MFARVAGVFEHGMLPVGVDGDLMSGMLSLHHTISENRKSYVYLNQRQLDCIHID
jgi:hypothetical protein